MHDVIRQKATAWNKNLRSCIKARFRSQAAFADALNEKYGTSFNQRTVSRWVSVGEKTQSGTYRGFPEFQNMIFIADTLGVDLGYLIGETNQESFTMEKACEFTGLNDEAIKAIKLMTSRDSAFRMVRMMSSESRPLLNSLLSAKQFCGLIKGLKDLDDVFSTYEMKRKAVVDWAAGLDSDFVAEVLKWAGILEDAQYDGLAPNDEVLAGVWKFHESNDNGQAAELELEKDAKIARYELFEAYIALVEELYPR